MLTASPRANTNRVPPMEAMSAGGVPWPILHPATIAHHGCVVQSEYWSARQRPLRWRRSAAPGDSVITLSLANGYRPKHGLAASGSSIDSSRRQDAVASRGVALVRVGWADPAAPAGRAGNAQQGGETGPVDAPVVPEVAGTRGDFFGRGGVGGSARDRYSIRFEWPRSAVCCRRKAGRRDTGGLCARGGKKEVA